MVSIFYHNFLKGRLLLKSVCFKFLTAIVPPMACTWGTAPSAHPGELLSNLHVMSMLLELSWVQSKVGLLHSPLSLDNAHLSLMTANNFQDVDKRIF